MNLVLGIDPGGSGALALINEGVCGLYKMPETEKEIWDLFGDVKNKFLVQELAPRAVIENVHSSPQMGVSSAFTFGKNLGMVRMCLVGHGYKFVDVSPQAWKKAMRCQSPPGTVKFGKKDYSVCRARAQESFPATTITNWNCDALMIARMGQQLIVEGKL